MFPLLRLAVVARGCWSGDVYNTAPVAVAAAATAAGVGVSVGVGEFAVAAAAAAAAATAGFAQVSSNLAPLVQCCSSV